MIGMPGIAGGVAAGQLLRRVVVTGEEPLTFGLVVLLPVATALVASLGSGALRAGRVHPVVALRQE